MQSESEKTHAAFLGHRPEYCISSALTFVHGIAGGHLATIPITPSRPPRHWSTQNAHRFGEAMGVIWSDAA
ncbi:MAG: hypothetical protein RLY87_2482 [Chloroflexota bacterium]